MTEIYITFLQWILSLSSRFRRFEMKNFLRRPTMVAGNISGLVAPPRIFFISTGLSTYTIHISYIVDPLLIDHLSLSITLGKDWQ